MHLVESCQPEGGISRRKYYRLNQGGVHLLVKGKIKRPASGQIGRIDGPDRPLPITKTTPKDCLKKSKESPNGFGAADPSKIPAVWKPDPRSKEQKLAQTLPPSDYPSEQEFNAFVESNELDGITNYRPDLYGQLCDAKWRKWNDRAKQWVPIRDWRAYVTGLNDHIQDNF